MFSLILTVHNKDWLIGEVIRRIRKNTICNYELIVVLDGCTDNSEAIVLDSIDKDNTKVIYTPDVFETKANNAGLRMASGDYVIIIQDDMLINEYGWNVRMRKPFDAFGDVFAVTSRTSHNWKFNPNTKHLGMIENLNTCWSDICIHTNHSDRNNTPRNEFAIRSSVNRGPLLIDHSDLQSLNYLDEEFSPQDMDDHDLMYRMHKKLEKVCGCYWIDYESRDDWGGTRVSGSPASWLLESNHKNMKIFYERHKDLIHLDYQNENRKLD
jgi:glycosyltransferase involved in cell wall biosynthesis